MYVTCGGNWTAETEAEVVGADRRAGSTVMTAVETAAPSEEDVAAGGELAGRLFGSLLATMELATVYLGAQLGLYAALAEPRTADELAEATGIDARYAQEWLEQQAIAGLVDVAEEGSAQDRRYALSAGQRMALCDEDSPVYASPLALMLGGLASALPVLPDAFRRGTGISFGEYGDDVRLGQGLFNRGGFLGQLAQEWIPAMPGVARAARPSGRRGARPRLRRRLVEPRAGRGLPRPRGPRRGQRRRLGDGRARPTPSPPGCPTGCGSRWPTRRASSARRRTTWRSTSSACTTWPTRWPRWPPPGGRCAPTGSSW